MDKNYPIILSLVYKSVIDQLCESLNAIENLRYFVLYIIFNNGKKFVLSSTPKQFLSLYWHEKLYEHDFSSDLELFRKNSYYLCSNVLGADLIFKEIIEEQFDMHRTFYISRSCPECRFVFGALHDHQVIDPHRTYNASIEKFEDFCINFIDQSIDIIKFHNPHYARSIILNDKHYRKSVIKNNFQYEYQLTEREAECLYWAAHGKSSDETAIILNIKKSTVAATFVKYSL